MSEENKLSRTQIAHLFSNLFKIIVLEESKYIESFTPAEYTATLKEKEEIIGKLTNTFPTMYAINNSIRKLKAIDGTTYLNRTYKDPFTQSDVDKITDLIGEDYSISNDVTDLTGLERFTKLKKLELFPQGPTTLDLTGMSELEEITLGGTMATITGGNTSLKRVILKENRNVSKLDLTRFYNIREVLIKEQSTTPNHIECIAVPANRVEEVKASINITAGGGNADLARQKTELYRDKYDKKGNWIGRFEYQDGKPTTIIERQIEYF